jgi:hypothetical protein
MLVDRYRQARAVFWLNTSSESSRVLCAASATDKGV